MLALVVSLVLCSCEAANQGLNKSLIENDYKNCLARAQTAEDSAACRESYNKRMEEENQSHEEAKNAKKEIDVCESFQETILLTWGYSEKDSKTIAKELRKQSIQNEYLSDYPKGNDYSFDCSDAIKELLLKGCADKNGVKVFASELPKFGLSSSAADNAINTYYKEELYINSQAPTMYKNPLDICLAQMRTGKGIIVTKELLIKMELLDDDENDELDEVDGNDVVEEKTPEPEKNIVDPTTHNTDREENGNTVQGRYHNESVAISNMAISKYRLNEYKLSPQQMQELGAIIAFMKEWPNSQITIFGHTCSIGSDAANEVIGKLRAHQAKKYLVSQGIEDARIEEISKAASEPCASNESESGRLQNRRITFVVK